MKKKEPFLSYEEKYLITELEHTQNTLAAAYSSFEYVTDPDLIDSCIYQVNSAQKKYKFLLDRAQEAGITLVSVSEEYKRGFTP